MQTYFRSGPRIFDVNIEIGGSGVAVTTGFLHKTENGILHFTCKLSSVNSTDEGVLGVCYYYHGKASADPSRIPILVWSGLVRSGLGNSSDSLLKISVCPNGNGMRILPQVSCCNQRNSVPNAQMKTLHFTPTSWKSGKTHF